MLIYSYIFIYKSIFETLIYNDIEPVRKSPSPKMTILIWLFIVKGEIIMDYKIEEVSRVYNGNNYKDLVLTFENGKKFILVPLCFNNNLKVKSYFYALLLGTAKK